MGGEQLVRSAERVRDLGEVFTPAATVEAMLDLLPATMWAVHPAPTFLEPACGDGNFLVAILARKLAAVDALHASPAAAAFAGFEAVSSIYAVDISPDNIHGTPAHGPGARARLQAVFADWLAGLTPGLAPSPNALALAAWLIAHNVLVADMLAPARRDLPLHEYAWHPADRSVTVTRTTFGTVLDDADENAQRSLFDPGPEVVYNGPALGLPKALAVT